MESCICLLHVLTSRPQALEMFDDAEDFFGRLPGTLHGKSVVSAAYRRMKPNVIIRIPAMYERFSEVFHRPG